MCGIICLLRRYLPSVRVLAFFFFSSRRRHTRYIGDWSSDVCSSDLNDFTTQRAVKLCGRNLQSNKLIVMTNAKLAETERAHDLFAAINCRQPLNRHRSEERRVGKSVDHGGRRNSRRERENQSMTPLT